MIRAFRDTWKDGVHSYLAYLRDRLSIAHRLLDKDGSLFVQIGDENLHLVRSLLDEIFGYENFKAIISYKRLGMMVGEELQTSTHFIIWFIKKIDEARLRKLFLEQIVGVGTGDHYSQVEQPDGKVRALSKEEKASGRLNPAGSRAFQLISLATGGYRENTTVEFKFRGNTYHPGTNKCWRTTPDRLRILDIINRISKAGGTIRYKQYLDDFPLTEITSIWTDTARDPDNLYVVQTPSGIVERCLLMATEPGDLVLDPTCGSGTTAYVAEKWGRRWITIDTSRVALALARQRLMAARYRSYLLNDSSEGARKEGELAGRPPKNGPFDYSIRQGFVYERLPHITLKSIANNSEIDAILERWQPTLARLLDDLNEVLEEAWQDWEVPRDAPGNWPAEATDLHNHWWKVRGERQKEIEASIARNAEIEYLVDRPYDERNKVRVAGAFTVESLSPHRVLSAEEEDALLAEDVAAEEGRSLPRRTRSARREEARRAEDDFVRIVLDNLLKAGVQNTKKGEKLEFTELKPWPGGRLILAEGRYEEGGRTRRVGVTIGPEYGTVSYGLVREAAREALDSIFDTLIVCGFAYEPKVNEEALTRFPRLTVLKARMNNDLHLADSLRSQTNNANLFVIFGEPDITIHHDEDGRVRVEILGLDIFDPTTGEVRSSSLDDIAAWFIDTDYDGESFFVRHAYFLGGNDPYKRLKTTLKAEIDEEAWATLYSAVSRPFEKPETGRIAVKVINHYGDEVLKVYTVV